MSQITLRNISITFRGPPLLDAVGCVIQAGERIGLLGRNGAGKTTFLRILAGELLPDEGEMQRAATTRIAILPQDVPKDLTGTAREIAAGGMPVGEADWVVRQKVDRTLSDMKLSSDERFETMSAGMKRRVALARTLVSAPDVLLLDEPTNHLDIDSILWLEEFLSKLRTTLIFVTHDRMFLRKLANRILEIDRGRLFDWACDYPTFLERKEAALSAEAKQDALFDKKLAREEVWIREGIKARRTRNEGRVRALQELRRQRAARRNRIGNARLQIQEGVRSGDLVAEVKKVSYQIGGKELFRDFSTTVMRGDKVGVIGANGVGKTTLLRVLLGQLEPKEGRVKLGTNLQFAYFDQTRDQLKDHQTVRENVGEGTDTVFVDGRARHVIGYLQDFLFSAERAKSKVEILSGGERNRLLLAKLFSKPANVLVLDEPTNDLDEETLELLEQRLVNFSGSILLVSHDREFLNNVVTSTIVFEPEGIKEYIGGYDDWLRQKSSPASTKKPREPKKTRQNEPPSTPKPGLSYKQKQELAQLPELIENLEAEIAELHQSMADPAFFQQPPETIAADSAKLKELEQRLSQTFVRWEELEILDCTKN